MKTLNIDIKEEVYQITRLRLADGEPMLFETSYMPVRLFPHLTKEELEQTPMYEIFRAVVTNDENARWLQIQAGEPSYC